jgi:hypothetical protein
MIPPASRAIDPPAPTQALISLNAMYDKRRAAGGGTGAEVEFRAYHLLTLLGTHGRYRYSAAVFQSALSVRARARTGLCWGVASEQARTS